MRRPDGTGSEKRLPQEIHTDKALQLQCLLLLSEVYRWRRK
jgi:hypothetical protein